VLPAARRTVTFAIGQGSVQDKWEVGAGVQGARTWPKKTVLQDVLSFHREEISLCPESCPRAG
jgi:hypothetical protein